MRGKFFILPLMDLEAQIKLIEAYVEAATAGDAAAMADYWAEDFAFDAVHRDSYGGDLLNSSASLEFWRTWFAAFSEFDWEHTRTIVTESTVVSEWIFTGKHDSPLDENFGFAVPASDRVIRFRGTTIYELNGDRIARETMYMDLATLMVELGITP